MLSVVAKEATGECDEFGYAFVGQAVEDCPPIPTPGDEAAPAKTREVIRDFRLSQLQARNQVPDRRFCLAEQLEDAKPCRAAEPGKYSRRMEGGQPWRAPGVLRMRGHAHGSDPEMASPWRGSPEDRREPTRSAAVARKYNPLGS